MSTQASVRVAPAPGTTAQLCTPASVVSLGGFGEQRPRASQPFGAAQSASLAHRSTHRFVDVLHAYGAQSNACEREP